ncbi:hypothetical protein [Kitasatospora sp. NPDC007106]|uniref:hypothetical protein n=1 Tax=Kitasatospora sp. NPDC007106 TaxID=3156914 RepID=UPI0033C6C5A7
MVDGPTWWRYGHHTWEPLAQALANPDGYAAHLRRDEAERDEKRRREAERKGQLC